MKTVKVPFSDKKVRCIACGGELAPIEGPREAYGRVSDETKGVLLACQDCRKVLPEAWAPVVLERIDDGWMKVEPVGPESTVSVDVAQQTVDDAWMRHDEAAHEFGFVPPAAKIVKMKDWALKLLVGDAASQAKCTLRRGFMILPGDLCLMADDQVIDAGQTYRDLKVVRDSDLKAGDAPFAYVVNPDRVRTEGRVSIIRFKGGRVQRSFVKKFAIQESERRFVLTLVGEEPVDAVVDLPSADVPGKNPGLDSPI